MKICYLAQSRLPTERAHATQIVKMCEAFASVGHTAVSLIVPSRRPANNKDIFSYYNVKPNFSISTVWSPDLLGKTLKFGSIFYWLDQFFFLLGLIFTRQIKHGDILYSRDPLLLSIFSQKNHLLCLELHSISSNKIFILLARRAHRIIVLNSIMRDELLGLGFKNDKIIIASDAVDLAEFDISLSQAEARIQTNLPQIGSIVIYTGHLYHWKGADTLAEAARLLPDVTFVFVGGVDLELVRFKNMYGNIPNIILTGFQSRSLMPTYLKAADVLVIPNSGKQRLSSHYTSPLKLFEYMASKRPIVSSDLPSMREVLNENNCFFAKADNPESFKDSIQKLLGDKGIASKLAAQAFADVGKHTWSVRASNIIDFIKQ